MSRGAWAIACVVLAALAVGATAQEGSDALEDTTPVTWELEGRGFPTEGVTEGVGPVRSPAELAEEDAFAERMKAVYDEAPAADGTPVDDPAADGPPEMQAVLWRALGSLCLVLGLILLLGFAVRRYAARTPLLAGQQLGRVVGKVSLGPRAALHYVRTGGRILVVGVSQNNVTPVAEFEEDAFDPGSAEDARAAGAPSNRHEFLEALGAATAKGQEEAAAVAEDDELTQLRSDLQRLRHYLREGDRDREV